jgi:NAD(P)-dependent dehydrogenase (short-subunit alcohol dehydrogenase family)
VTPHPARSARHPHPKGEGWKFGQARSSREQLRSQDAAGDDPLAGKIIAVVGGSRGIGFAIAQAAGRAGATLALIARKSRELQRAATELGAAIAIPADVTRPRDVQRAFREIGRRFSKLDVLVNSAGTFTFKPLDETTLDDWQQNLDSNLTSLFLTTRAALPMLTRSRGHIVNILSISSRQAFARCSAYTAAKFGALGFTRVLAEELRPKGIRVTAVLPGATNTRLIRAFGFPVDRAALVQPEDVAETVLGVLRMPTNASVDEIVITPSRGAL